jgi:hypothetical protein
MVVTLKTSATEYRAAISNLNIESATLVALIRQLVTTFEDKARGSPAKRGRVSQPYVSIGLLTRLTTSDFDYRTRRGPRLSELATLLESITVKPRMVDSEFVRTLFDTLSTLVGMESSQVVYAGQQVMSTISACLKSSQVRIGLVSCRGVARTHHAYISFQANAIRPESVKLAPVLDMIRSESLIERSISFSFTDGIWVVVSNNPQVSNQALLLVAELAAFSPNQVVSNVMPIFTFMGTNLLQRDDAYSARVVENVFLCFVLGQLLGCRLTWICL